MIRPAPKIRLWLVPDDVRDPVDPSGPKRKSENLRFRITQKKSGRLMTFRLHMTMGLLGFHQWYAAKLQWPATNQ